MSQKSASGRTTSFVVSTCVLPLVASFRRGRAGEPRGEEEEEAGNKSNQPPTTSYYYYYYYYYYCVTIMGMMKMMMNDGRDMKKRNQKKI